MISDTRVRIISYIRTNGQARVKDLVEHLGLGPVAIHRHLKALLEAGKLIKTGTAPKVFYQLSTTAKVLDNEIAPRYIYNMNQNSISSTRQVVGKAISDQLDDRLGPNLEKLREVISAEVGLQLEEKLNLEPDQTLDDKLKYLPTKDEFFDKIDEVMGELKVLRQVQGLGLAD